MGDASLEVEVGYLSAGANRQTGAADWNEDGTLAFGADCNVCLWKPTVAAHLFQYLPRAKGADAHARTLRPEESPPC